MLEFQCQHTPHIYYLQDTEMKNFKQEIKSLSITSPEQLEQICLFKILHSLKIEMKIRIIFSLPCNTPDSISQ